MPVSDDEIQRWMPGAKWSLASRYPVPFMSHDVKGVWVKYSDHAAALEAAHEVEGEGALRELLAFVEFRRSEFDRSPDERRVYEDVAARIRSQLNEAK